MIDINIGYFSTFDISVFTASYILSLSIGATRYEPQSMNSLEELLAQADSQMYQQKREKCTDDVLKIAK